MERSILIERHRSVLIELPPRSPILRLGLVDVHAFGDALLMCGRLLVETSCSYPTLGHAARGCVNGECTHLPRSNALLPQTIQRTGRLGGYFGPILWHGVLVL
jgi:hypothetical protein